MFKHKHKQKKSGYEVTNLGAFIVERVQLPHSLIEVDGSRYEILTLDYRLRVDDGPILYEQTYGIGSPKDLEKMQTVLSPFIPVENECQARYNFYGSMIRERFS